MGGLFDCFSISLKRTVSLNKCQGLRVLSVLFATRLALALPLQHRAERRGVRSCLFFALM
jgi:hypothetical protein